MTGTPERNGGLTRRRLFRLAAGAAAAGAALPAAGPFGEWALAAAAKRGGTLTVGVNTDLVSLDPNDIVFANVPMFFQVYNYLVKYSTTLQPRPDLAEFWDLAKDGMSVVFRLQKGGGTGPFRVQEWVPGDRVTFVRFDGYWQKGLPLLDRVVCRVFSDPQALENAFQAGTIDIAHTIVNKDVARLRQAGFHVEPAPVPNEYYVLTLNTRRPPLDNI